MIRWLATVLVMTAGAAAWAGPIPPPVQNASPFPLGKLFASPVQTPHPSVVRVVVQEREGVSLGSGALVAVYGTWALVLTNWHVVRDAAGTITVIFPDGFRSGAAVLKVDPEWDLAALAIWRPQADPIPLAAEIPRVGEPLTIVGYGSGPYRAATGRCLQYLSPGRNQPPEMIELSVAARQGDSGGPILNSQGELAGVLFGASWGRTAGSSCRRVHTFLESVPLWFGPQSPGSVLAWSETRPAKTPPSPMTSGIPSMPAPAQIPGRPFAGTGMPRTAGGACPAGTYPPPPGISLPATGNAGPGSLPGGLQTAGTTWPPSRQSTPPASIPSSQGAGGTGAWPGPPTTASSDAASEDLAQTNGQTHSIPATSPLATPEPGSADGSAPSAQNPSRFEVIKNFLAFVGAVALLLQAVKLFCAGQTG